MRRDFGRDLWRGAYALVGAAFCVRKMPDGAAEDEASELPPTIEQRRPDHGFISDTNPSLVITRNEQGHWIVRDTKGQFRGAFLLRRTAVSFVAGIPSWQQRREGFEQDDSAA